LNELYLKKLKSEYDYLKSEVEYQSILFKKAKGEFDKRFQNKLDLNVPTNKKIKDEDKSKKRTKSLDKVYKKLAQKIHPDKKTGDTDDFKRLKQIVDEYDMDAVIDLAVEYDVDITVEIDEEEFFITNINKLKGKLQFYGKTLIMQWYNIDDSAKENFENFIMATLGK
tara:strand:- start:879 stop:1382 length:504 start_codon:yes stop_codon:yes gene_type:complete